MKSKRSFHGNQIYYVFIVMIQKQYMNDTNSLEKDCNRVIVRQELSVKKWTAHR